jgi:DNA-binding MarR family transcriptional regulator
LTNGVASDRTPTVVAAIVSERAGTTARMHFRPEETDIPSSRPNRDILHRKGYADAWTAVLAVRGTQRRLEVALDQAISAYGVSFGQYRALLLTERNPLYISDAARRLRITRQATDRLYAKLALSGLIHHTYEPHVVDVEITDLGRERLAKMRALIRELVTDPVDAVLDMQQLFALTELLDAIDRAVRPNGAPTWWLED